MGCSMHFADRSANSSSLPDYIVVFHVQDVSTAGYPRVEPCFIDFCHNRLAVPLCNLLDGDFSVSESLAWCLMST